MKYLQASVAILTFADLMSLNGCVTSDAVKQDGGALERELNYENAVQSEAAGMGY